MNGVMFYISLNPSITIPILRSQAGILVLPVSWGLM